MTPRQRTHGPGPAEDDDDDLPDIDEQALADLAFRRMSVAARRGHLHQALAWGRLRDMVLRQARARCRPDAPSAPAEPPAAPVPPSADADHTRAEPPAALAPAGSKVTEVHDVHPLSPFAPGLDRAERRRRLKSLLRQTGPP